MLSFLTETAGWMVGLGSLTSLTLRWWSGDHFLLARLGSYFLPWMLVLLVPGFILAALLQRRWLAVSLLLPALIIIYLYAPLFSPGRKGRRGPCRGTEGDVLQRLVGKPQHRRDGPAYPPGVPRHPAAAGDSSRELSMPCAPPWPGSIRKPASRSSTCRSFCKP